MIAGPSGKHTVNVDKESAAWLLEKLLEKNDRGVDRSSIRRAIDEAVKLWPETQQKNWWKWIVEASRSLGLKCKVIDGTVAQVAEIAGDGGRLIVRLTGNDQWIATSGENNGKCLVLRPFQDPDRRWEKLRKFQKTLDSQIESDIVRCVVFEPQLSGTISSHTTIEGKSPFGRLISLLYPERGDIAVILVFALVTGLLALATPLAVETLVNTVAFGRVVQPVVVLALMLLAFLTFSAALRVLQAVVVEMIQRRLFARTAADLSFRIPRIELETLDGQSGRELINRFFDIVTVQKVSAQLLLDGIALVLGALIGMAVLAFYHPWLLGFDVVLLGLIAFIIVVLGRGAISTSIKESKTKYSMAAWLESLTECPVAFRSGGSSEFALERSDRLIHGYLSARKSHFRVLLKQMIFALGLQAVASTALLGLGGWLVMSGQLTLGQLVAAELIVTVIVGSFAKMGKHLESFYDLLASVDKLGVLFDLPMEAQEGVLTFPDNRPAKVFVRRLSFVGNFGKDGVKELDLQIRSGERIVIHGRGGSGKSRFMDLLFGIRNPESGYITINDVDPRDMRPDALRRHVALVRNVEVFGGTIAENIHLERPDVTMQDVRDALINVGLLEKVLELHDGLDTKLVETGYPLSASHLRKLMIARAIAGKPRLLLIDGVLDSLSDDDFNLISEVLFAPDAPWTLIATSGRGSLIQKATQAICFDDYQKINKGEVQNA